MIIDEYASTGFKSWDKVLQNRYSIVRGQIMKYPSKVENWSFVSSNLISMCRTGLHLTISALDGLLCEEVVSLKGYTLCHAFIFAYGIRSTADGLW